MTEPKFTTGPWKSAGIDKAGWVDITAETIPEGEINIIASTRHQNVLPNANLIVSAPKLYNELEEAVALLKMMACQGELMEHFISIFDDNLDDYIEDFEAVLTEARGELLC